MFIKAFRDRNLGFQLYQSDPSGNYIGWQVFRFIVFVMLKAKMRSKATAIGANSQTAHSILKSEYRPDLSLQEAKALALRVLKKILGVTTLSTDSIELLELTRAENDSIYMTRLSAEDLNKY